MSATRPQGPFCQSCSMPMQKPEDFGTNPDGSKNEEYCNYCFQNGEFTDPNMTVDQMVKLCDGILRKMNVPEPQIEQIKQFIPMLKRWRTK